MFDRVDNCKVKVWSGFVNCKVRLFNSKGDILLFIDIVYKLAAPCTLIFLISSYFYSVKPVFDKHSELQQKSSQIAKLKTDIRDVSGQFRIKVDEFNVLKENYKVASEELNQKEIDISKLSVSIDDIAKALNDKSKKAVEQDAKLEKLNELVTHNDRKLLTLNQEIELKTDTLSKLNKFLDVSESAAVNMYIQGVINEVVNERSQSIFLNAYNDSIEKFNLKSELLSIVNPKLKVNSNYDRNSEKYYEQLALKEIKEFTLSEVKDDESDYKKIFDILYFRINKKYKKEIDAINKKSSINGLAAIEPQRDL